MNTVDEEQHVKDIQQCSLNTSLRKLLKNSKFHHKAATTFRLLPTTHHIHISTLLQVTSSGDDNGTNNASYTSKYNENIAQ